MQLKLNQKTLKSLVKWAILLPVFLLYLAYFTQAFILHEILIDLLPFIVLCYLVVYIIWYFVFKAPAQITLVFLGLLLPFSYILGSFYFSPNPLQGSIATDNSSLKVLSFNIYYHNQEIPKFIDTLNRLDPDVILLYELTPLQYKEIFEQINTNYPYSDGSQAGNGYFSKIKPYAAQEVLIAKAPTLSFQKLILELNSHKLAIYGIHPPAPVSVGYLAQREPYLDELVKNINGSEIDQLLIVGDFNMSPWNSIYYEFMNRLKFKMTNAAQGQGINFTWSITENPLIPITQIDHAVLSDKLYYSDFSIDHIQGSDHKSVFIRVSNKK